MEVKNIKQNQSSLDFSNTLLEKYPELSPTELKICSYLRMNLSSKTIAQVTNRSLRTIEYTRNNIRKKMKLKHQENLIKHLITIQKNQ